MKPQEIFNTVAKHLLRQNKRAVQSDQNTSLCMYRSPDGSTCAAGCLIPPEKYDPNWEGKGIPEIYFFSSLICERSDAIINFLTNLQYIHDCKEVSSWREELIALAAHHSLDDSVCKEIS